MATGLTAAWQGMQAVTGDRTMPRLKKAFGQYNAYEDPKFYRDWEAFERNPNPQRAKLILDEYGDSLEIEDQAQLYQMIQPDESTLQGAVYAANKNLANLKGNEAETLLENNYGELSGNLKLSNAELGLDKNNLAAEQIDYDSDVLNYKQQQKPYESSIDAQISSNETNIMQNNMTQQEIEALLDEGVPEQKAATAIAQLEANEVQSLYNKLMNQNKVNDAEKLYNLFMRSKVAGTETAESNATITGNRADISTATKEDEIQMVKDNAVLSRLEKELGLYSQPYRKQNVVYDNNIKGNQSDVSDLESYKANKTLNYLQSIGEKELMTAMGYGNEKNVAEDAIDIKYTIPNPYNDEPLAVNQSDIVVNRVTGQPFQDQYGQYYKAEKDFFSGNVIFSPYGGQGNLSKMKNVLMPTNQQVYGGDEGEDPSVLDKIGQGYETLKNYLSGDNGDNESQQSMSVDQIIQTYREQNPDLSYQEIADRIEKNIDPETFKQQTGQNLNAVIGRLRMMR